MKDTVICVRSLGKQYRLGQRTAPYRTIRETIVNGATASIQSIANSCGARFGKFTVPNPKNVETIWAIKDVSFEIQRGEVVGIIGRNGAGKSTLLKMLSRITQPTEGRAEIRGRVGSLLEVGIGFHPELSGRENIYLNGAILGMKRAEIRHKFDEIVAFAEIDKFIDTPVKHYSSGMYVRLAFAVAAHLELDILLVDEVLAVGDAAFQKKCLGKIGNVAKEGRTVLFVSHNMSAVLNLCSIALLLQQGTLLFQGCIKEGVETYLQSLRTGGGEEVDSYTDRRGEGLVRFTRVWFEDERGRVIEQAISGNAFVVALQFQSQIDRSLLNCRVSIAVHDMLGQALFVCSTEMARNETVILPPAGIVRCSIPRLPLSQGRYNLTLFLEENHEVQDWLESAVALDVLDGDYFGTGRQYPNGWQGKCVLVPHEWEL